MFKYNSGRGHLKKKAIDGVKGLDNHERHLFIDVVEKHIKT